MRSSALVSFYGFGNLTGARYSEPDPHYCTMDNVDEADGWGHDRWKFFLWCRQNGAWPIGVCGFDPKIDSESFHPYESLLNGDPAWPPTMLFHGQNDTEVPHEQSVLMSRELANKGVPYEFVSIPGGGHGFDSQGLGHPDVSESFAGLERFLGQHV